mmetsp:Transcript_23485/g.51954  ORF Transcript_23485/g.51954 Transcript_23485/m.51954 type:complete len:504 (-) Transcript_23485:54-1565(-)
MTRSMPAALLAVAIVALAISEGAATEGARSGLRLRTVRSIGGSKATEDVSADGSESSCVPLKNMGTHSTVEVEVGTPGQSFDLVADTGSDSIIVTSCACRQLHHCAQSVKCFQGTNRSSTFSMTDRPQNESALVLTFGSGTIVAVLASDMVRVGEASTMMDEGVLLMVNQALRIPAGDFQGILGLGLPSSYRELPSMKVRGMVQPKGFLETAGVGRFSMCFNDKADGVLRLGTEAHPDALPSIGKIHWGLDFRGVSIGSSPEVAVCSPSTMKPGQVSPCGAIPDSGTTVMMAPKEHIVTLLSGLCDEWPRCQQETANFTHPEMKHIYFMKLLMTCSEWMTPEQGLDELPPLKFHFNGSSGKTRQILLKGSSYILQTMRNEVHYVTKHLMGVIPMKIPVDTVKKEVCLPAFSASDHMTQNNGPIWILGTPFFYEYDVHYDMTSNPPSIAFSETPCGSCSKQGAGLVAQSQEVQLSSVRARHGVGQPRLIRGPLRLRDIDPNAPF